MADVGSPIKNSLVRVAGYFLGRNRAAQPQEERAHQEDGSSGNNAVEEPAHEVDRSARLPYTKRTRLPVRDVYQHPSTPSESEEESETMANRPPKRLRPSVKAEQAFVKPKRSLRNTPTAPNRPSRPEANRIVKSKVSTFRVRSSLPEPIQDVAEQPAKRPRGRPRKIPLASPRAVPAMNVSIQKEIVAPPCTAPARHTARRPTVSSPKLVVETTPAPNEGEADEQQAPQQKHERNEQQGDQELEDVEENQGFSSILLDPSPIKVSRNDNGKAVKNPRRKAKSTNEMEPKETEGPSRIPENEDIQLDDSEEEASEVIAEVEPARNDEDLLFETGLVDDMVFNAGRVGYSYNKERKEWTLRTSHKVLTKNGKRMIRRQKAAFEAYGSLQKSIDAGDTKAAKKARKSIDAYMEELQKETRSILTKRLGNPLRDIEFFDADETRVMLLDLYFLIIPDFLKIFKLAAEICPPKRSMNRWTLEHFLALTTMLENLASTAALQPKASKPRANSKSDTYHLSKPSSRILPDLRKIRISLSKELAQRLAVQKASEFEASQAERSRQIEEHERLQDEELRKQRREICRQQREVYEALYSVPRWGRLLKYKNEARNGSAPSRDPDSAESIDHDDEPQAYHHYQDIGDKDDPFAESQDEDDDEPRLSVFGTNNKNDSTRSRPLSEKEKETFVECMMNEHGADRYEKAAERLERSIEEIFTFAQDLQEAMDRKHESGHFMKQQDDWTFDIWIEKEVKFFGL